MKLVYFYNGPISMALLVYRNNKGDKEALIAGILEDSAIATDITSILEGGTRVNIKEAEEFMTLPDVSPHVYTI
jgi:hypothetical protein